MENMSGIKTEVEKEKSLVRNNLFFNTTEILYCNLAFVYKKIDSIVFRENLVCETHRSDCL